MSPEDEKPTSPDTAKVDETVNEPDTPSREAAAEDRKEEAAKTNQQAKNSTDLPAAKTDEAESTKAAPPKAAPSQPVEPADAPQASAKAASPKPAPPKAAPARPAAKKEAAPPDPRVTAAKETADRLAQALNQQFGDDVVEATGAAHFLPMVQIKTAHWAEAVGWLKTHPEWQLNYVECMAGTDYPNYIEIVLYVQSTGLNHFICLKTRTSRDEATVPSLVASHPGVNWEEREIYDLLGVNFTNHPDLRRIMMWDDFKGHPLRKDYSEWESR